MASRKRNSKKTKSEQEEVIKPQEEVIKSQEEVMEPQEEVKTEQEEVKTEQEEVKIEPKKAKIEPKKVIKPQEEVKIEPKHKIGGIVYISKDAEADLNGFKLFPQYKKYTYTVEAYEPKLDVYTLRRLNLSLKLNGRFILAPEERAHDSINRRQF